jgi:hypothetical protein
VLEWRERSGSGSVYELGNRNRMDRIDRIKARMNAEG